MIWLENWAFNLTKRVLISGGASVLGKGLAERFRSEGCQVWQGVRTALNGPFIVSMDVTEAAQVRNAIEDIRPQLIFHLAASYEQDLDVAVQVNVRGVRNVIDAVAAAGLDTRTVVMGSAAEYGVVGIDENPIAEDRYLRPVSTYGLTKSWQTLWSLKAAFEGKNIVVARMFNLDAHGLPDRLFVGSIERQINQVRSGERTELETGALDAIRDYVGLEEAVDQLCAIAAKGARGGIYHVASGRPISMRDFLRNKLEACGLAGTVVSEQTAGSARRGYDVPMIYADLARTRALQEECR